LPWAILFWAFSPFSLSLVTSAATGFVTLLPGVGTIGPPLSYPGRDNGRTMNGIVNAPKAPAPGAFVGRFGAAGLLDRANGPCLSSVTGRNGSAGVLACEFGRRLVARRGTWPDAPQTRSRDGCATLAGGARSDWQIASPGFAAACGLSRIIPPDSRRFFVASAQKSCLQVVENQRRTFWPSRGGISANEVAELHSSREVFAQVPGPRPHGCSYATRRSCPGSALTLSASGKFSVAILPWAGNNPAL